MYGLIFLLFFFNGPGPLSVDSAIYSALAPDDDDDRASKCGCDEFFAFGARRWRTKRERHTVERAGIERESVRHR